MKIVDLVLLHRRDTLLMIGFLASKDNAVPEEVDVESYKSVVAGCYCGGKSGARGRLGLCGRGRLQL